MEFLIIFAEPFLNCFLCCNFFTRTVASTGFFIIFAYFVLSKTLIYKN